MKISQIYARQILDSRGVPTVEVDVTLENGATAQAAVPSGASTGIHEAAELRDGDKHLFGGMSVLKAIENVNGEISDALVGQDSDDQKEIDEKMVSLDGTSNKGRLGANAILGVSIAVCKAAALSQKISTYAHVGKFSGNNSFQIPRPMILMLEGGKHGNWATDIQEFMIMPTEDRFGSFMEILAAGRKIFLSLEGILKEKGYSTGLGFEGAFCPQEITSNEEALELLTASIQKAGFKPGEDFSIALDFASSEFFENGNYVLKSENNKKYSPQDWTGKIIAWTKDYPIFSLEDVHQEDLWESWTDLTGKLGKSHQVVGDDLVTTNLQRIKKAIETQAINSVIIKPNQIGTVTETLKAVSLTKQSGWTPIVSHRAGETNDDFIADFAVGTGANQSKFGGLNRGERISKYNRLLRIEEQLGIKNV